MLYAGRLQIKPTDVYKGGDIKQMKQSMNCSEISDAFLFLSFLFIEKQITALSPHSDYKLVATPQTRRIWCTGGIITTAFKIIWKIVVCTFWRRLSSNRFVRSRLTMQFDGKSPNQFTKALHFKPTQDWNRKHILLHKTKSAKRFWAPRLWWSPGTRDERNIFICMSTSP